MIGGMTSERFRAWLAASGHDVAAAERIADAWRSRYPHLAIAHGRRCGKTRAGRTYVERELARVRWIRRVTRQAPDGVDALVAYLRRVRRRRFPPGHLAAVLG